MSADGAAMGAASPLDGTIVRRDASSDLAQAAASANPREVDVLRNSLSAVMVEYHEQSKKFASMSADHARLRARCSELERRLFDIESSTSWAATRRLREVFIRHPRLHRLVTTIRLALARQSGAV
jgi:hypothetical protein